MLNEGGLSLFYPLPFSTDYNNEAIYFQPQIFFLGQLLRILPIDLGILLTIFGFVFTVLGIRVCIQLYSEYIGFGKGWTGHIVGCFFCGGEE